MHIGHSYNFASGPERQRAFCLAYRFDADLGFEPDAGESHLLEFDGTLIHTPMWKKGWLTGLWRSESGLAYVTDYEGRLHIVPSHADSGRPRSYPVAGLPMGVWGLDDSNVWIWGRKGGEGIVHHFDGARITELPSPGKVLWMHGVAPDLLVAVGERGLVTRWDGGRWNPYPPVSSALLSSVHVVSPDEMYACGNGRELWDGSVNGWSLRYRHEGPLGFVVRWHDRVWVAAGGDYGLSELIDDRLESRKPNLLSTHLDYRDHLLITGPAMVVSTPDAVGYKGLKLDTFVNSTADLEPSW